MKYHQKMKKRISIQIIILLVFIVTIQTIEGFYAVYGFEPPGAFVLLRHIIWFWLIGDWFMKDSKKHKVNWAFDMGFFLLMSWPILIPFYLFKTRGFKMSTIVTFSFIALHEGIFVLSYYAFYYILPD